MGRVPVAVMNVVGVVLMRHGHMTAARAVLMGVALVHDVTVLCAFVGVVAVRPVNMPLVHIVGVVAVRDRDVPASVTMGMLVTRMSVMQRRVGHRGDPLLSSSSGSLRKDLPSAARYSQAAEQQLTWSQ